MLLEQLDLQAQQVHSQLSLVQQGQPEQRAQLVQHLQSLAQQVLLVLLAQQVLLVRKV